MLLTTIWISQNCLIICGTPKPFIRAQLQEVKKVTLGDSQIL